MTHSHTLPIQASTTASAPTALAPSQTGLTHAQTRRTRALLTCGVVAGPLYVGIGALEMLTRPGFDVTRHSLSVLSNGDLGWIHSGMLVGTGLLTIAGALGMRRILRGSRGGTWGPLLVGLYGLGLIGAGSFSADPALGFRPGTPMDANAVSWHGALHLVCGSIGFIGLIAACLVFARRFAARKQPGWAAYSAATGVLFVAAFFGIAAGSSQSGTTLTFVILAFSVAVVLAWAWVTAIALRLQRRGALA